MGASGEALVKFNTAVPDSKEIFKQQTIISVNATPILVSTEQSFERATDNVRVEARLVAQHQKATTKQQRRSSRVKEVFFQREPLKSYPRHSHTSRKQIAQGGSYNQDRL